MRDVRLRYIRETGGRSIGRSPRVCSLEEGKSRCCQMSFWYEDNFGAIVGIWSCVCYGTEIVSSSAFNSVPLLMDSRLMGQSDICLVIVLMFVYINGPKDLSEKTKYLRGYLVPRGAKKLHWWSYDHVNRCCSLHILNVTHISASRLKEFIKLKARNGIYTLNQLIQCPEICDIVSIKFQRCFFGTRGAKQPRNLWCLNRKYTVQIKK